MIDGQLGPIAFTLVLVSFHGLASNKQLSHAAALRPNTKLLPMLLLNYSDCASFRMNLVWPLLNNLSFGVRTLEQHISLPNPFSILEQKHIEIDFQFVRDVVHNEQIHVKFLSTKRSDCWPANKTSGHTKVPPCPVQSQRQGTSLEIAGACQ